MSDRAPQSRSHRRRPLKVALGVIFVLAMVTGGLAYRHFTAPVYVRAAAIAAIERSIGGRCSIGEAGFSLRTGVHLKNVSIAPATGETVFSCEAMSAKHDPLALLGGEFRLTALTATAPTLSIVYDDATRQSSLAGLFTSPRSSNSKQGPWPTVELKDASIQLSRRGASGDRLLESLNLTVRGRVSRAGSSSYDVVWHDERDGRSGHSQVDLSSGLLRNVTGGLPAMSLESVALAVASQYDAASGWSDLLGLAGKVVVTDFNLIESPQTPKSATVALQNAALSIPTSATESEVSPDQRYFAFTGVSGDVVLTSDAVMAAFNGNLRGSDCSVQATIRRRGDEWASLREMELDGTIRLRSLHLPRGDLDAPIEERRFFDAWPQLLSFQEDYDPRGPVDVDISLSKNAGEDRIEARRATITLRGGEASARWFPYQCGQMRGTVEYSPDGVEINDVCGDHEGGTVCVSGHFAAPNKCSPAQMRIIGKNVPFDDYLLGGLEDRYRRLVKPFHLDKPLEIVVDLARSACDGGVVAPWKWNGSIGFDRATLRHDRLEIPLEEAEGVLRFTRDRIESLDVRARTAGAPLRLTGSVQFIEGGGHHGYYQAILTDFEPGSDLLSLLPRPGQEMVAGLHPSGRLTASVGLESEDEIGLRFISADLDLRSLNVEPTEFPVPVRSLQGPVKVDASGTTIGPLRGLLESSHLEIEGRLDNTGPEAGFNLAVQSPDLLLSDSLRAALPPSIRETLSPWRTGGPIDVKVQARRNAEAPQIRFDVTAALHGIEVEHHSLPQPLRNVRGTLLIDNDGVRSKDLSLEYTGATAAVDLKFVMDQVRAEGSVAVMGSQVTLDDAKRLALPPALRSAWDRAAPRGALYLDSVRLQYAHLQHQQPTWTLQADVGLSNVSLLGLGEIERIDGRATLSGDLRGARGTTALQGELRVDALQLSGREFTNITAPWTLTLENNEALVLTFPDVRGEVFGGTVGANFAFTADDRGGFYSSSAMIYGMNLAPWIDAGRRRAPEVLEGSAEYRPSQVRGRVNLTLSLSGDVGDVSSRRGAGQIEIREGFIYRLPVLMAVLNVVNISLPKDEFVHDAEATFYIVGNQLSLEAIQMQGGPLTLIGSGSVSLPDQAVDLRLYATSATALSHVPLISDIIEGTTKELIELRVTGPISRPVVRPTPFRGVSDELKRLFQKKEKKPLTPARG